MSIADFSSDDDDAILLSIILKKKKALKRKRKYWIHPLNSVQPVHGEFVVYKQLCLENFPDKFRCVYRMQPETYRLLLSLVGPTIVKKDTNYRLSISPEERLMITIRYLATGRSFRCLSLTYFRGETSIAQVIEETCVAIWEVLGPKYMPVPTEEKWIESAKQFTDLWQMPNCIGSIDGKHVRIRRPPNSGSMYFNYVHYFSMVLLAVCDADCKFSVISVGDYGRNSDGGVLRNSTFGRLLSEGRMNLPQPTPLPNEIRPFPFYFVADEAFSLTENVMRPYPARNLDNPKRIFNGRLSRARKTVECAFGRLSSKFRFLYTRISCEPHKAEKIVKAACMLHNFILVEEKDSLDIDSQEEEDLLPFGDPLQKSNIRGTSIALFNRDRLKDFFLKNENAVPWQNSYCV